MRIPSPGLGTWQNKNPDKCKKAVKTALNIGYRHIDTAQIYENEAYVGKGIKASEVARQDIFIASKVWIDQLQPGKVISSTKKSLQKLGVDQVDLMYVHWPSGDYEPEDTLNAMTKLIEEGYASSIGVSNFTPKQLEEAMNIAGEHIIANQVEMHPLLQQNKLLNKCQEHGIKLVAYSPLARGKVENIPEIQDIADKHNVSEAQVSLAWLMQRENVVPIPKASSKTHIRENLESKDLNLEKEDIKKIESIQRRERQVDPNFAPW